MVNIAFFLEKNYLGEILEISKGFKCLPSFLSQRNEVEINQVNGLKNNVPEHEKLNFIDPPKIMCYCFQFIIAIFSFRISQFSWYQAI